MFQKPEVNENDSGMTQEDSSFSEEKEAKRLLYRCAWGSGQHRTQHQTYKSLLFFSEVKEILSLT